MTLGATVSKEVKKAGVMAVQDKSAKPDQKGKGLNARQVVLKDLLKGINSPSGGNDRVSSVTKP